MHLLRQNADLAISLGYKDKNAIVGKNGRIILFDFKQRKSTPETVPAYDVMVDGLGVGDLKDVVIRDRQLMSADGILNIVVLIDSDKKVLFQEPDIVSKGFVDMEKSQRLIAEIKQNVQIIVEGILSDAQEVNTSYIRDEIRDQMGQFVYAKTERRPMVLPVVVII
jgi:ribonuclease J